MSSGSLFGPNPSSGVPIYLQLMERVKHAVETGAIRPGDQLPGIRPLAEELVINPNTVAKAYRELEHLGTITAEHGSGYYVAQAALSRLPALSGKEKKAKLRELCRRFSAEARGHGISFEELVAQLQSQKTT